MNDHPFLLHYCLRCTNSFTTSDDKPAFCSPDCERAYDQHLAEMAAELLFEMHKNAGHFDA